MLLVWPERPHSATGIAVRSAISLTLSAIAAAVFVAAIFVVDDITHFTDRIRHPARTHTTHDHGLGVELVARRTSPTIYLAVAGAAPSTV
jgi:hypothetical protein